MRAELVVWLAAAVAAQRYANPLPRPACYDGPRVLPGMRRRTWFRLLRLITVRAEDEFGRARPGRRPKTLADLKDAADAERSVAEVAAAAWRQAFTTKPVRQMIETLALEADDAGQLPNVGKLIAGYAKHHGCDERTAYRHWRIVRLLGIVRQTQHSAYGRHARYVLCFPPARVPASLPEGNEGYPWAPLADEVATWAEHVEIALGDVDDLELYRYGSCRYRPARTSTAPGTAVTSGNDHPGSLRAYYCQAWPLYAKATPPSPRPAHARRADRSARRRPGGISDEDRTKARAILARCRPRWAAQQVERIPCEEDLAQLIGLIALVLRYSAQVGPSDVVDLLTERVGSARDLAALLRYRLQATLRDLRRRRDIAVDDDGSHGQARRAAEAATRRQLHQATAERRAEARALAEAVRARKAAQQAQAKQARAARRSAWPTPAADCAEQAQQATTATQPQDPAPDEISTADMVALQWAMHNARKAMNRRDHQPAPIAAALDELPEHPHR